MLFGDLLRNSLAQCIYKIRNCDMSSSGFKKIPIFIFANPPCRTTLVDGRHIFFGLSIYRMLWVSALKFLRYINSGTIIGEHLFKKSIITTKAERLDGQRKSISPVILPFSKNKPNPEI